jgi:hypothetical protein
MARRRAVIKYVEQIDYGDVENDEEAAPECAARSRTRRRLDAQPLRGVRSNRSNR